MYTKDKKHKVELRLNDELFEFVKADAENYEMSVSSYVRMLLQMSKQLVEKQRKEMKE